MSTNVRTNHQTKPMASMPAAMPVRPLQLLRGLLTMVTMLGLTGLVLVGLMIIGPSGLGGAASN